MVFFMLVTARQLNRRVRNSFYFYINKAQFFKHLEKTSAFVLTRLAVLFREVEGHQGTLKKML